MTSDPPPHRHPPGGSGIVRGAQRLRVVETKLRPPMLRDDAIVRERLLGLLDRSVFSHPLTLVSAPAGYGKTTLLASIGRVANEASVAWLSLDEDDNDPNVFAGALVASLRRGARRLGAAPQDPSFSLSRLRARQQVAEIRMDALRLHESESREFLNDTLHLGLSKENIALLQRRTEGWPAGLTLMVSALRRLPAASLNRDAFLAHLRHIDQYVFDFLASEIFETLKP